MAECDTGGVGLRDWWRRQREGDERVIQTPLDVPVAVEDPKELERAVAMLEHVRRWTANLGSGWWLVAGVGLLLAFVAVFKDFSTGGSFWGTALGAGAFLAATPLLRAFREVALALPEALRGNGPRVEVLLRRVATYSAMPLGLFLVATAIVLLRWALQGAEPPVQSIHFVIFVGVPLLGMSSYSFFLLHRYGEVVRTIDDAAGKWTGRDPDPPERVEDPFKPAS